MEFYIPSAGMATTPEELVQAVANSYSTFLALVKIPTLEMIHLIRGSFSTICLVYVDIN